MKNLHIYLSLLFILTCAKEDSQDPNNAPSQITRQYTLSVSSGDGGSVSSAGGTFLQGTQVSITATPSTGYVFSSWSNGSTTNPLNVTLNSNTTVTANFEALPNTYTVTLTAGEGGSVSGEGAYEEGTQITLTATPDEGYQFVGWSNGSVQLSLDISIEDNLSLQANFEMLDVVIKTKTILIDSDLLPQQIQSTFYNVSGVFTYKSGNDDYIFYPGSPNLNSQLDIYNQSVLGYSRDHIPNIPSLILKNIDGYWEFFETDSDAKFWGSRNFEIKDNFVIVGDGNEIGEDSSEWKGDSFFGEILNDGNINWVRVNDDVNMAFFHGSAIGDLNNDGLMDIGGAPASPIKIFLQNNDKSFEVSDDLINYGDINPPFTLNFADVFGDSRDEIITADYGGGDPLNNAELNQIRIYSYDDITEKFELHWKSNNSTIYNLGLGATSIKVADLNNDGIKDISVAREDYDANAFEVWIGNGDGTFYSKFTSPVWTQDEMQFREFYLMDVNLDGFEDIILRPFHYGSLYRNNPVWWNVYENNGIMFNHLIWINQGDGSFNYYNTKELKVEGINIDNVHPYMKNGKLHFVGTFTEDWNKKELITYDFMINL
jgi:hypothetical protein